MKWKKIRYFVNFFAPTKEVRKEERPREVGWAQPGRHHVLGPRGAADHQDRDANQDDEPWPLRQVYAMKTYLFARRINSLIWSDFPYW